MYIWVRLGVGASLTGFFYLIASKMAPSIPGFFDYRGLVAAGVGAVGALIAMVGLIAGQVRARPKAQPAVSSHTSRWVDPVDDDEPDVPIFGMTFWGPLLLAFGGVLFFLPSPELEAPVTPVQARSVPARIKPAPAVPEPEWPPLKLQGITYASTRRSAIINHQTYLEGEALGPVKVLKIEPRRVVVLYHGETNVLRLEDPTIQRR